jgi:hypothetical protein
METINTNENGLLRRRRQRPDAHVITPLLLDFFQSCPFSFTSSLSHTSNLHKLKADMSTFTPIWAAGSLQVFPRVRWNLRNQAEAQHWPGTLTTLVSGVTTTSASSEPYSSSNEHSPDLQLWRALLRSYTRLFTSKLVVNCTGYRPRFPKAK